jgi:malate dehydrogenase (oxaloacetate-decarboxylating)
MARLSPFFDLERDAAGRETMHVSVRGMAVLRLTLLNKGTGFTLEERIALGLDGLLPPQVNSLEQQVERAWAGYVDQTTPLQKYQFLRGLQDRSEILFYALLERHLEEMLPIVYTPTVGQAVQRFSHLYQTPRGISLAPTNIDRASAALDNYPLKDVRMIVATDSSAILGIGDQGYGGLAIPIGKLSLYTVAGGVSPFNTMPVSLDVGTDRAELLGDPMYLGVRQRRLRGEEYLSFVDRFVEAVRERCPRAVIQWEDLAKDTAFTVLERYRERVPSFNDDIQGTGAVALAGVMAAARLQGRPLVEQVFVVHGAGAGGIGVAAALRQGLVDAGLPLEAARARVLVLDSKGLLTDRREMEGYKRDFAQPAERVAGWAKDGAVPSLEETIRGAKATALLGLSGQPGSFDERVVRAIAEQCERPIVFPLSNPTSSCEAVPADVIRWTDGRAIVAAGSPFEPVEHGGARIEIGQGNNAFVFPGLGLGAILADASKITDGMVLAAAYALARYTERVHGASGRVYPPVSELRAASHEVATAVVEKAFAEGVARAERPGDVGAMVRAGMWQARYVPYLKA